MPSIAQKSTFVTVVAWVFIVLSGFGTLISLLQNLMIQTVFTSPEVVQAAQGSAPSGAPPFAVFMLRHMVAVFVFFLLVQVLTLASSIGLLMRRNWARRLFIGVMAFGIVWNLGGLVLQFAMFSSMREQFAAIPDAPDMRAFFIGIAIVCVVFALGFSALFGWIAKRLMSPQVVAEFAR